VSKLGVIGAVDGGSSCRAAAVRFGVGVATAIRWVRVWRDTGSIRAKPKGGDLRSHRIEAYRVVILAAVEAEKDITLAELAELLAREHGTTFAISTLWRFFTRHRITLKKNRTRRRAGPAGRRRRT
jgi:transposase